MFRFQHLAALSALALMTACSTSLPTNYYLLTSPALEPAESGIQCQSLGINKLELADYLNGGEFVTAYANGEAKINNYKQWLEPLDKALARQLTQNLSQQLPASRITRYPWSAKSQPQCRLNIFVDELVLLKGKTWQSQVRYELVTSSKQQDRAQNTAASDAPNHAPQNQFGQWQLSFSQDNELTKKQSKESLVQAYSAFSLHLSNKIIEQLQ